MIEQSAHNLSRQVASLLLALTATACAGSDDKPLPPAPAASFSVQIRDGDTVPELAQRYQVKEDDILALNRIYDRQAPTVGDMVRIPAYGHLRDPRQEPQREASAPQGGRRGAGGGGGGGGRNARGAGGGGNARLAGGDGRGGDAQIERSELADVGQPQPRGGNGQRRPEGAGGQVREASLQRPAPQSQSQASWMDWLLPGLQGSAADRDGESKPSVKFLWPVNGEVLSPFGSTRGGERNDGINISAARGAPVHAAADGTVSYVGNELKGYGNLVLIRHDNGYVTAYAHADGVAVERGERVKAGQVIAYAGTTGDVSQPQVHFEVRLGTKPVDPQPFLGPVNSASSPNRRQGPG